MEEAQTDEQHYLRSRPKQCSRQDPLYPESLQIKENYFKKSFLQQVSDFI